MVKVNKQLTKSNQTAEFLEIVNKRLTKSKQTADKSKQTAEFLEIVNKQLTKSKQTAEIVNKHLKIASLKRHFGKKVVIFQCFCLKIKKVNKQTNS